MRAWELTAKGIIEADEATAEALERHLAEQLHGVLAKSYFGAHYSVLGTPSVHGSVHVPQIAEDVPAELAPAPAPAPAVAPILQAPAIPAAAPVAGPVDQVPEGFPFTADQLNGALAMLQQAGLITPVPAPAATGEVPAHQQ